jgi:hypothetical protein
MRLYTISNIRIWIPAASIFRLDRDETGGKGSVWLLVPFFSLDFSLLICVVWYSPDFCTRSFSISILRLEKKKKSFPLQMWHRSVWALHIGPSFQTALLALIFSSFFLEASIVIFFVSFFFFSFLHCLAKKVSFFSADGYAWMWRIFEIL